ncbi:MAG: NAD-dependent epimerase/dehydratase family protein [Coxiellaceae bacterium]|nr:NAD-dependent epimerase/dehydratase family protein [Coxiellaceae bacterium]
MNTANKKRVLITGATGFVGSALANYFYSKGMIIRATARNADHFVVKNNPHFEWLFCDLTTIAPDATLCNDVDFVLHTAGYAHASKKTDPEFQKKHQAVNFQATVNLGKLAEKSGVKRFIFFSSVKAVADANTCIDETWTVYPEDPYGRAKRAAEEALLTIESMEVVILRLSLVYGVGWKGNLQTMLIAIDKKFFPPLPALHNQKSMVSLADVCLATDCALSAALKSQRLFIVTDGQSYATDQIDQSMRAALGQKIPKWSVPLWMWTLLGKMGDGVQKLTGIALPINSEALEKLFGSACYRSIYIQDELGFVPQHTFSAIIPDIVRAYRHKD